MKTFARLALAFLAITVVCQVELLAEEYYFTGGEQAPAPTSTDKVTGDCTSCCPNACGCEECGGCTSCMNHMGCDDDCRRFSVLGFAGFDSFRGISDDLNNSNFGAVSGLNSGLLIPGLDDYGFGWQTGLSLGVYDLDGAVRDNGNPRESQQQTFITTGFFRKAKGEQRLSFGLVYDWMLNTEWGYEGTHPTMGQWRGQIEYALNGCNSVGVWGTVRDTTAFQTVRNLSVESRAINQASMFWRHKFNSGANSVLYVGAPENIRLNGDHSLLNWTFGANVEVPLSKRLALYANGSYSHPTASASAVASVESGYDVSMGIVWYFGGKAKTDALNGTCSTPYMSMGNNSNFLVDQVVR